jgi:formylglycine-generating enzyme required for sulfatase activity
MEFRLLPPGKFMMGAPGSPAENPASPPHDVTLTRPFYMATFETTRGQFARFCDSTGWQTQGETEGIALALDREASSVLSLTDRRFSWRTPGFEQQDDHPVIGVNREDALAFCEWLASTDGRKYRLPTEAEWEYACRAGTADDTYWSMQATDFSSSANFMDASLPKSGVAVRQSGETESDGHCFTAPVGTFPPNPFGLHDMAGNVGEWCSDRFGAYADSPQTDPAGPETGDYGLFRGGHWLAPRNQCYSWYRGGPFVPNAARANVGFRVVCEVETTE